MILETGHQEQLTTSNRLESWEARVPTKLLRKQDVCVCVWQEIKAWYMAFEGWLTSDLSVVQAPVWPHDVITATVGPSAQTWLSTVDLLQ